jgi:hypothetical protein
MLIINYPDYPHFPYLERGWGWVFIPVSEYDGS